MINKENLELFNKALHEVKFTISTIKKEKEQFHKELNNIMITHDTEMDGLIKELLQVINDLYELINHLL